MTSQIKKTVSKSDVRASSPKAPEPAPASSLPTIVLDMGSVSRKKIRQLKKRAEGPLLEEVQAAIEHTRQGLAGNEDGANLVPVVMLYRKKPKKKKKIGFPPLFVG
jgi:hypothetical protein